MRRGAATTAALTLTTLLVGPAAARAQWVRPPDAGELARIEASVHAREVDRAMRFRRRWRLFAEAGVWVLGRARLDTNGVHVSSDNGTPAATAWVGVRRAVVPWLDVLARAGVAAPFGLQVDGPACPPGAEPLFAAPERANGVLLAAEVGVRVRPITLVPFYLGAGVVGGALVVYGDRAVTRCRTPSSDATFGADVGATRALLGTTLVLGLQLGRRERFDVNVQGVLFGWIARSFDNDPVPALQISLGWLFT